MNAFEAEGFHYMGRVQLGIHSKPPTAAPAKEAAPAPQPSGLHAIRYTPEGDVYLSV